MAGEREEVLRRHSHSLSPSFSPLPEGEGESGWRRIGSHSAETELGAILYQDAAYAATLSSSPLNQPTHLKYKITTTKSHKVITITCQIISFFQL
jgi:hypothetical protein